MSPSPNETSTRSLTRLVQLAIAAVVAVGLAACAPSGSDPREQELEPTSGAESAEDAGEPAASTSPPDAEHDMPGGVTGEHPRDRDDEEPDPGAEESAPAGTEEEPAETAAPSPLAGRLIALDPGHNGGNFDAPDQIAREVDVGPETKRCNTVGAVSDDGYRESTFNIELAERLRAMLEARGAEVVLTREGDDGVGPCIDERGTFGQDQGTDLMISIHADGAPEDAHGFHVIRPGGWEGESEGVVDRSRHLATLVRDRLVEYGLTPANYAGTDGIDVRSDLGTLNLAEVPAVLLEAGNMHNDHDLAMLRSAQGQDRIGAALADAIEDYLGG